MSSNLDVPHLTSADLAMIQGVLDDAGYDARVIVEDVRVFNVAAMLLIKLFQEGMKSPADLSAELDRHFGRLLPAKVSAASVKSRYAIQGLPVDQPPAP